MYVGTIIEGMGTQKKVKGPQKSTKIAANLKASKCVRFMMTKMKTCPKRIHTNSALLMVTSIWYGTGYSVKVQTFSVRLYNVKIGDLVHLPYTTYMHRIISNLCNIIAVTFVFNCVCYRRDQQYATQLCASTPINFN